MTMWRIVEKKRIKYRKIKLWIEEERERERETDREEKMVFKADKLNAGALQMSECSLCGLPQSMMRPDTMNIVNILVKMPCDT